MKKVLLFIVLMCAMHVSAQVVATNSEKTSASQICPSLDMIHGKYYLDDNLITTREYKDFLKNNSPEAWQRYKSGSALWATGWSLLGVSTVASYTGIILFLMDGNKALNGGERGPGMRIGAGLVAGAGLFAIAGIPCVIVGGKKKFTAHELYTENCAKQQNALTLSVQTSQNGLGLALNF